ncbi:16S rRNA (uracil(1498)-N(3))-methyltransferase [Flavobacteriales bacterium]|jgi:16S rRNA (uracil1498-N3)-methyltransferase|nr:16S rRNA (uracil(1498)-N(3))-methyltransferase [Flavobacteriales bacterium]MDC3394952.1 16S rRNA (uracil(1498)-N(3))-methyltransferase [Flavobacteriales bacterium]
MQLFYLENPEKEIILSAEESKHATKVLRKKEGDILNFTDGKGAFYKAEITVADTRKCRLEIVSSEQKPKQHNYYLHIAIAPTKNMDRYEWFLEKATEIGIDEITPIICSHSERKVIKTERCNRILLSAMKQSLKFHLPKMNEAIILKDFLKQDFEGNKYIAHCEDEEKTELRKEEKAEKTLILIGPEGDFSPAEIEIALQNQFKAVSLGKSRLRTETAGLVAVHTINIKN